MYTHTTCQLSLLFVGCAFDVQGLVKQGAHCHCLIHLVLCCLWYFICYLPPLVDTLPTALVFYLLSTYHIIFLACWFGAPCFLFLFTVARQALFSREYPAHESLHCAVVACFCRHNLYLPTCKYLVHALNATHTHSVLSALHMTMLVICRAVWRWCCL